jgi:hypothetical protein
MRPGQESVRIVFTSRHALGYRLRLIVTLALSQGGRSASVDGLMSGACTPTRVILTVSQRDRFGQARHHYRSSYTQRKSRQRPADLVTASECGGQRRTHADPEHHRYQKRDHALVNRGAPIPLRRSPYMSIEFQGFHTEPTRESPDGG